MTGSIYGKGLYGRGLYSKYKVVFWNSVVCENSTWTMKQCEGASWVVIDSGNLG